MRTYRRLNLGAVPGLVAYNPFQSALPPGVTAQQLAVQSLLPPPVPTVPAAPSQAAQPTWTPQAQIVLANQPTTAVTGNAPAQPTAADMSTAGTAPAAAPVDNSWLWIAGGALLLILIIR